MYTHSSKFPTFVGFNQSLFDVFDTLGNTTKNTYPYHNILRIDDNNFEIEIALAGYSESDLSIEIKDSILKVSGDRGEDGRDYVHKGISQKGFNKTFQLSDTMVVKGAAFKDGLLIIYLNKVIPEDKMPKTIPIRTFLEG